MKQFLNFRTAFMPMFIGFAFSFSACNQVVTDSGSGSEDSLTFEVRDAKADVVVAEKEIQESEEITERDAPMPKSKADLGKLHSMRNKAFEQEKAYFESPRIKSWISNLKDGDNEDGMPVYGKLETGKFHQLTVSEGFYYYLVHPEMWDQICAESSFESGDVLAIAANLPWTGGGDYPSERQTEFVQKNLIEIESMVLTCLEKHKAISPEMMQVLVEFKLKSAIPVLVDIYKSQSAPKDDLILTTMVTMMNRAEFPDWEKSELKKAFGEKWYETIELNDPNADKICFYAKKYAAS